MPSTNNIEYNYSQNNILRKIQQYLQSANFNRRPAGSTSSDEQYHKEAKPIYKYSEQFDQGFCAGISNLWLYTKWLQTQPNNYPNIARDDYDWFIKTIELIAQWNGITPLTLAESAEIDRFIAYISYFQKINHYLPIAQNVLEQSLTDTQGRTPTKEYSITAFLTREQLIELLNTPNVIQENRLITVASSNHTTALFKQAGVYYYFDPNNYSGEVAHTATDELADHIFYSNDFEPEQPSPLGFTMFAFANQPNQPYPEQATILAKIAPSVVTNSAHAKHNNGIILAASVGCLESTRYYLHQAPELINSTDSAGNTALILAAEFGHIAIVKLLLEQPDAVAKINHARVSDGATALILAAHNGHTAIVELLVEKLTAVEINYTDYDDNTALILAASEGYTEIVASLITKLTAAEINQPGANDLTALMLATMRGHTKVVEALLTKLTATEVSYTTPAGNTALKLAKQYGYTDITELLNQKLATAEKNSKAILALTHSLPLCHRPTAQSAGSRFYIIYSNNLARCNLAS